MTIYFIFLVGVPHPVQMSSFDWNAWGGRDQYGCTMCQPSSVPCVKISSVQIYRSSKNRNFRIQAPFLTFFISPLLYRQAIQLWFRPHWLIQILFFILRFEKAYTINVVKLVTSSYELCYRSSLYPYFRIDKCYNFHLDCFVQRAKKNWFEVYETLRCIVWNTKLWKIITCSFEFRFWRSLYRHFLIHDYYLFCLDGSF